MLSRLSGSVDKKKPALLCVAAPAMLVLRVASSESLLNPRCRPKFKAAAQGLARLWLPYGVIWLGRAHFLRYPEVS